MALETSTSRALQDSSMSIRHRCLPLSMELWASGPLHPVSKTGHFLGHPGNESQVSALTCIFCLDNSRRRSNSEDSFHIKGSGQEPDRRVAPGKRPDHQRLSASQCCRRRDYIWRCQPCPLQGTHHIRQLRRRYPLDGTTITSVYAEHVLASRCICDC